MIPIYHHYEKWEDFKAGMYNYQKEGREMRVKRAVDILSKPNVLYELMKMVTEQWPIATEQNLSNNMYGRHAFLGQTACNILDGVKEDETREAWGLLTDKQRIDANKIADKIYVEWVAKMDGTKQISLFEVVL